ncbi:hypothetical protein Esti_000991 [Eimeria stiedai]
MNSIFFDMLGQGVLIYMDDALVYTATIEEHLRLLDSVLARLLQHKMYHKLANCKCAAQFIEYLGCCVGADGIHPSTEKVSAPTELINETQVRQFLGTVNYCRNFMGPELAVLARPLQQLPKEKASILVDGSSFLRSPSPQRRLIHYIKLSLPDLTTPFIRRTDASGVGIGAVLEQDGHLVFLHLSIVSQPGPTNVVTDPLPRCPVYEQDPQHASSKVLSVSSLPPTASQQSCISASNPLEPAVRASLLLVRAKVGRSPKLQIESNTNVAPPTNLPLLVA